MLVLLILDLPARLHLRQCQIGIVGLMTGFTWGPS